MTDMTLAPQKTTAEAKDYRKAIVAHRIGRAAWWLGVAFVFFAAILSLMPLYWMISGAFKDQHGSIAYPPQLLPNPLTLKNWSTLLFSMYAPRWLLNSVIVAVAVTILSVITSTLAGYAFGKKSFPGRLILFWTLLLTMMLPKQISLIPLFVMMRQLKWFDSYWGMIVPYIAYPFGIFLMRQFMQSIPDDLLDAGRIDGASEWQVIWKIVVPLSKPAIGALAIFAFMFAWNDYLWQLVIVNKEPMMTLPVGISKLVAGWSSLDIGLGMAGATLAFIPMLILFLLFQDYFVKGITVGAVKG
jgi:multiple sugar transport system permease protein